MNTLANISDARQEGTPIKFIVRRNQSLSWQGNQAFILFIGVVCFAIATGFATQGLWLVLPFAGLEMLALTICLYVCCLRNRQQEVITVNEETLLIEKGEKRPTQAWEFERGWVSLELKKSKFHGYPSKLLVRSKGVETEIGECLTNEERRSLADSLDEILHTT